MFLNAQKPIKKCFLIYGCCVCMGVQSGKQTHLQYFNRGSVTEGTGIAAMRGLSDHNRKLWAHRTHCRMRAPHLRLEGWRGDIGVLSSEAWRAAPLSWSPDPLRGGHCLGCYTSKYVWACGRGLRPEGASVARGPALWVWAALRQGSCWPRRRVLVTLLTQGVKDVSQLRAVVLTLKHSCVYKIVNRNIILCFLSLFPHYTALKQVKVKIFIK